MTPAKQILYKKATDNNDGFLSGQVGWITEAMQETAIMFAKWINAEGWQQYDEADRWICPSNNYNVYTTSQLYDKFEKSKIGFIN